MHVRKGHKQGSLVVAGRAPCRVRTGDLWWCDCVCGRRVKLSRLVLERGRKSCGCGRNRHGGFGTAEYGAWMEMRRRCYDPRRREYKDYGGRGIKVCPEWDDPNSGFEKFLADVGPRPAAGYTIGRKENDKDYTPDNVEWQTVAQQNRNRRNSIVLTFRGQTLTLMEWAKLLNEPYGKLRQRLSHGWSVEATLTGKRKKPAPAVSLTDIGGKKKK